MSISARLAGLFAIGVAVGGCDCSDGFGSNADPDAGASAVAPDAGEAKGKGETGLCPSGTDGDRDGFGEGCGKGPDCDDGNPYAHVGLDETCDFADNDCDGLIDEDVQNDCGDCDPGCAVGSYGDEPFPDEPPYSDLDGVGLNDEGDLVLDSTTLEFHFLWIANSEDLARGTVSKVRTSCPPASEDPGCVPNVEVARYYSTLCVPGDCTDTTGGPVQTSNNYPSRTAVDFSGDAWVANRAFGGQGSVTKYANDISGCVDRDADGVITTSADWNDDGMIDPSDPDEFPGDLDECILFTTNLGGVNYYMRSIALDAGDPATGGPGNAWAATNNVTPALLYKVDGTTGAISETLTLPAGSTLWYGGAVDGEGILWLTNYEGYLTYVDTETNEVGTIVTNSFFSGAWCSHYGIAVDQDGWVWLGGCNRDGGVYRYKPDRTDFASLASGTWMRVSFDGRGPHARGVAPDTRGWVWVAHTCANGTWAAGGGACGSLGGISRIPRELPDGDYDGDAEGYLLLYTTGNNTTGAGVDFAGNIWGVNYESSSATRIDVDGDGEPIDVNGDGLVSNADAVTVPVGYHPYTYSDFTGYGLRNFTSPSGTYTFVHEGCDGPVDTEWREVRWDATVPPGTDILVYVRSGDDLVAIQEADRYGPWLDSPAALDEPSQGPIAPNPSRYLRVEFHLSTTDPPATPILHSFDIVYSCPSDIN
ncbi:MAG: putative metal-binding motif-containing protein [Myxococcota bacterium]